jgi:hypothetical protein
MELEAYQRYTEDTGRATKNIKIVCPKSVTWSCRVEGNFGLNVYEGTGPTGDKGLEITFFDDDDKTAYGNVIVYYYDNGCLKHLSVPVFYAEENKWLNVFPTEDVFSKSLTNEYKVFTLKTNLLKEHINVSTPRQDNYKTFITDNLKLYIIKTTNIDTKISLHTSVNNNEGSITVLEENLTN